MECMTLDANEGGLSLDDFRDRRREPRTASRKRLWVYQAGERPLPGRLVDCSPHGVRLLLQRPMREGEEFGLRLRLDRLRLVTYSVRYCGPEGQRYNVGALLCGVNGREGDEELEAIFCALLEAGAPR